MAEACSFDRVVQAMWKRGGKRNTLPIGIREALKANGLKAEGVLGGMHVPEIRADNLKKLRIPEGMTVVDVLAAETPSPEIVRYRKNIDKKGKVFAVGDAKVNFSTMCDHLTAIRMKVRLAEGGASSHDADELMPRVEPEEDPCPHVVPAAAHSEQPSSRTRSMTKSSTFRPVATAVAAPAVTTPHTVYDPAWALYRLKQAERDYAIAMGRRRMRVVGGGSFTSNVHAMQREETDALALYVLAKLATYGAAGITEGERCHAAHYFSNNAHALRSIPATAAHRDDFKQFCKDAGHADVGISHAAKTPHAHPFERFAASNLLRAMAYGTEGMPTVNKLAAASQLIHVGAGCIARYGRNMPATAEADMYGLLKVAYGAAFLADVHNQVDMVIAGYKNEGKTEEELMREWKEEFEEEEREEMDERAEQAEFRNYTRDTDIVFVDKDVPAKKSGRNGSMWNVVELEGKIDEWGEKLETKREQLIKSTTDYLRLADERKKVKAELAAVDADDDAFDSQQSANTKRAQLLAREKDLYEQMSALLTKIYAYRAEYEKIRTEQDGYSAQVARLMSGYRRSVSNKFRQLFFSSKNYLPRDKRIVKVNVDLLEYYFQFGDDMYDEVREILVRYGMEEGQAGMNLVMSLPELRIFIENLILFRKSAKWPEIPGGYPYAPPIHETDDNEIRYRRLFDQAEVLRKFLNDSIQEDGTVNPAVGFQRILQPTANDVSNPEKLRQFHNFLRWLEDEIDCDSRRTSTNAKKGIQARTHSDFCHVSGGAAHIMRTFGLKQGNQSYMATLIGRPLVKALPDGGLAFVTPRADAGYHASHEIRNAAGAGELHASHMSAIREELWSEYIRIAPRAGDAFLVSEARFVDWFRLNTYLRENRLEDQWPKRKSLLDAHARMMSEMLARNESVMNDGQFRARLSLNYPGTAVAWPSPDEMAWSSTASEMMGGGVECRRDGSQYAKHKFHATYSTGSRKMHVSPHARSDRTAQEEAPEPFANLGAACAYMVNRNCDYHMVDGSVCEGLGVKDLDEGILRLPVGDQYSPDRMQEAGQFLRPVMAPFTNPKPYPGDVPVVKTRTATNAVSDFVDDTEKVVKKVFDAPWNTVTADNPVKQVGTEVKEFAVDVANVFTDPAKDVEGSVRRMMDKKKIPGELRVDDNSVMNWLNIGPPEEDGVLMVAELDWDLLAEERVKVRTLADAVDANSQKIGARTKLSTDTSRAIISSYLSKWGISQSDVLVVYPTDSAMEEIQADMKNTKKREFFAQTHIFPLAFGTGEAKHNNEEFVSLGATRFVLSHALQGTAETKAKPWVLDPSKFNSESLELTSKLVIPEYFLSVMYPNMHGERAKSALVMDVTELRFDIGDIDEYFS